MSLTETQRHILHAVVDRILPPDDYPGAWDAGVGDYICRQLAGDLCALLPAYAEGLAALNGEAAAQFGAAFADLAPDRQDAVLQKIETGEVQTTWPLPPRSFFTMLIHHTAEGYYADPGNGGNRDALSWQMIGFEG
jgi:hypothetical protein